MQLETRYVSLFDSGDSAEVRLCPGETPNRFVGVIPFHCLSCDLGGFKERIMPRAFSTTITSNADVRALYDHQGSFLLGRTSNGTARIAENEKGLAVEIDIPDTSYGRDVKELVRRRDVRGLSFAFRVRENGQRFLKEGGLTIRELLDVDLKEVSVVGSPAYSDTTVALRSAQIDPAVMREISRPRVSRCETLIRRALVQG